MTMTSRHLLVSGKVQGVYYRNWSTDTARSLDLAGWVRNLEDGRVEILVEGETTKLDQFIQQCWQGPEKAEVNEIKIDEIPMQNLSKPFVKIETAPQSWI